MAIDYLTTYTGQIPNKITQTANEFHAACDTVNEYELNTLVPEIISFSGQVNSLASEISSNAQLAASSTNFLGNWSAQTSGPATIPTQVYHSEKYWNLLNDIADISSSEPGVSSDWIEAIVSVTASQNIGYVSRTSAYTTVTSDNAKIISCSGTFTLSLGAAEDLGAGWYCFVKNTGTGTITIDPDGSETINGESTYEMTGEHFLCVVCDGSDFQILVSPANCGYQLISTDTASTDAYIDLNFEFDSDKEYLIIFDDVFPDGTTNSTLNCSFRSDSDAVSVLDEGRIASLQDGTNVSIKANTAYSFSCSNALTATNTLWQRAIVKINRYFLDLYSYSKSGTAFETVLTGKASFDQSVIDDVTTLRVSFSANNIASGTVRVYERK